MVGHVIDALISLAILLVGIVTNILFGRHVEELQDIWANKHYQPFRRRRALAKMKRLHSYTGFLMALRSDRMLLAYLFLLPVMITAFALLTAAETLLEASPKYNYAAHPIWIRVPMLVDNLLPHLIILIAFASWLFAVRLLQQSGPDRITFRLSKFDKLRIAFESKWGMTTTESVPAEAKPPQ